MYSLILRLSQLLIFLVMKRRISGQENTPREGGLLIVSNHLGLLDPLAIGTKLPRHIYILAKAQIFSWPVLGWLARKADVIPIRRGQSDREAIRRVLEHLQAGHAVLIFPEGTYPKFYQPRGMLQAQAGAALLAQRSGAAVLPIGITGLDMVWSPRSLPWGLFRRWPVNVRIGEPYYPEFPVTASQKQALGQTTDDMMRRIAALLPPAYQGAYRVPAPDVGARLALSAQAALPDLAETGASAPAEAEN